MSEELGFNPEWSREELHAAWQAKYAQAMDLWTSDNVRNNEKIEATEREIQQKDARIAELARESAGLREALRFIRWECDWEGADNRIGPACDKALPGKEAAGE